MFVKYCVHVDMFVTIVNTVGMFATFVNTVGRGNSNLKMSDIQMLFSLECIEISKEKFTVTNCSNFEIVEGAHI